MSSAARLRQSATTSSSLQRARHHRPSSPCWLAAQLRPVAHQPSIHSDALAWRHSLLAAGARPATEICSEFHRSRSTFPVSRRIMPKLLMHSWATLAHRFCWQATLRVGARLVSRVEAATVLDTAVPMHLWLAFLIVTLPATRGNPTMPLEDLPALALVIRADRAARTKAW